MKWRRWMGWSLAVAACGLAAWWAIPGEDPERAEADRRWAAIAAKFEHQKPLAETGDVEAQFALAEAYRTGAGVAADPAKAVKWFTEAANRGHVEAQYRLGRMFEKGDGIQPNATRAAEWYRLAARLGDHGGAQFALGELYYKGRGVPTDYDQAIEWYLRAARGGHPAAQHVVGLAFADGWGVKRDMVEAYKWLTLAVPHRAEVLGFSADYDPVAARDRLAKRMHRFEVEQGEKRARDWKPEPRERVAVRPGATLVREAADPPPKKDETPATVIAVGGIAAMIVGADRSTQNVTLLVSVPKQSDVGEICALLPRVQDAVVGEFARNPIRMVDGTFSLRDVHDRLLGPINAALGRPMADRVFVVATEAPLTPNMLYLTPFDAVTDCDRWPRGAGFGK